MVPLHITATGVLPNSIISAPPPPVRLSAPSLPVIASAPAPPSRVSLRVPPRSVSAPPPPVATNLPVAAVPVNVNVSSTVNDPSSSVASKVTVFVSPSLTVTLASVPQQQKIAKFFFDYLFL